MVGHILYSQISVGVITDSKETMQSQMIINALVQEIDRTAGVNLRVTSAKDMQYFNVRSEPDAQTIYQNLNADLVLSIGGVSTKAMADLPNLSVPVIGIGVADPYIQKIPYDNGTSGKNNFTYILTSRDLRKEIKSFQKLAGFERLSLVVDPLFSKVLSSAFGNTILIDSLQDDLGIQLELIESGQDVNEVIASLTSAEAVYVSGLVNQEPEYLQAISNYLSEQRIPSYSTSKQHVEWGILASTSGENGREQVLRRIGIMADDILSGRNAATISVEFNTKENFYLNVETARKMAFSVPFEVLLTANMIGENNPAAKVYSFAEIAEMALENNLDIQISYKDINVAELDVRSNRSGMLPSVSGGLNAAQINEERANAAANSPERSLNLDLTLSQVIYSEEALASIKIAQYLKKGTRISNRSSYFECSIRYLQSLP